MRRLPQPVFPECGRTVTFRERFYKGYLRQFVTGINTGDTVTINEDGYVSILSRSDDVLNTAGHRLVIPWHVSAYLCS